MKSRKSSRVSRRSSRSSRFFRKGSKGIKRKNQKTHRNARRRQPQRQTGGGLKEDATQAFKTYATSKGLTFDEAFSKILNCSYYEKKDPSYNTMGLSNPCVIGDFVFRGYGSRDYVLQARLKTDSDTPDALKVMRANVARDLYPDKANNEKYVQIAVIYDR
jgi:hypothetical protein